MTLRLSGLTEPSVNLVLPSWVPGSYMIQDQAKFLRSVGATRADGGPLLVERVDKARWRVVTDGAASIEVRFEVYAHALLTDGVDLTPDHFWLNAGTCLPFVEGHGSDAYELLLDLPPEWRVFTELTEVSKAPPRFRANGYDELVDSPVDCGRPVELLSRARGIPHRLVLCGAGGNYDPHQLPEDIQKISEAAIVLFGDAAPRPYTFFIHLSDARDGGLEHRNSNASVIERNSFQPRSAYRHLLSLFAHEYLHRYLVKGIRPRSLGPFDYEHEVYTRLLWLMEGTTEYYAHVVLRRAGLVTSKEFLKSVAEGIRDYLLVPGRHRRGLEEASFLTWIDYYRPMEDTPNTSVSYYVKGGLVSLALDLEIRERTENRRSLDDVMRLLWAENGLPGRPLEESEFPPVVERATGVNVDEFCRRFVQGTHEIDFSGVLGRAGLRFVPKQPTPEDDDAEEAGYLGVRLDTSEGRVRVRTVLEGGPAERAGIAPGDELVALDGVRIDATRVDRWLLRYPPGTAVEVAFFARGMLRTAPLTLGRPPPPAYLTPFVERPTSLQMAIYASWAGEPWPAAAPPSSGGER